MSGVLGPAHQEDMMDFGLGPRLDVMFSPGSQVRPFVSAGVALEMVSGEQDEVDTSLTGFQLFGGAGLRWFAAPGFSVDPELRVGWVTASGEVKSSTPLVPDLDVSLSAFMVGLGVTMSGWIG